MDLMGTHEIAQELGVSQRRARALSRRDGFPDPLARLSAGGVWDAAVIRAYAKTRNTTGGRPKKEGA